MSASFWLQDLISVLADELRDRPVRPSAKVDAPQVWRTKLFCILSSQVSVSKAALAANSVFEQVGFFGRVMGMHDVEAEVCEVLASERVRYRFPHSKSRQIARSWFSFAQIREQYFDFLQSYQDEGQAREAVVATFPGLGMKQSSMLLRDIGFATSLAVIDTHVLWYLQKVHSVLEPISSKKQYEAAERLIRSDAAMHGLDMNSFDLLIFTAVRAIKARRSYV